MNFEQFYYLQTESSRYPLLDTDGNVILDVRGKPITNTAEYYFEKMRREINDSPPLPEPRPEWSTLVKTVEKPKTKTGSWINRSLPPDIQNETSQSAAIQNNNFGDFPMTTFQVAPEMLPIPNSNTANPIKRRKKGYVKPGNRKPVNKYNVGRVNMATTMLPYQGNGYSL